MSEPHSFLLRATIERSRLVEFLQAAPSQPCVNENWLAWWETVALFDPAELAEEITAYGGPSNQEIVTGWLETEGIGAFSTYDAATNTWEFGINLFTERYPELLPMLVFAESLFACKPPADDDFALMFSYYWDNSVMAYMRYAQEVPVLTMADSVTDVEVDHLKIAQMRHEEHGLELGAREAFFRDVEVKTPHTEQITIGWLIEQGKVFGEGAVAHLREYDPELTVEVFNRPARGDSGAIDNLILTDTDQRPRALVAMLATLYLPRGDDPLARQALAALIDEYVALAGAHLRWARWGEQRHQDLRKRPLASCVEPVRSHSEHDSLKMILSGAEDFFTASPFGLCCWMPGHHAKQRMGCLSLSLPLGFIDRQPPGFFFDWIATACERLQPLHGYAGLGLIRSMDGDTAMAVGPAIQPLAERFPGMEIDAPISHAQYLSDGIKGINWLTIVSDPLLDRIGGRARVCAQFSDQISVHDGSGGLIIQAGPMPQLGDRAMDLIPRRYLEVYRVLRPLQADYPDILIRTPDAVDPMEFKTRWMTRFA